MGLLPPQTARIDGGEIRFADRDLLRLKPDRWPTCAATSWQ